MASYQKWLIIGKYNHPYHLCKWGPFRRRHKWFWFEYSRYRNVSNWQESTLWRSSFERPWGPVVFIPSMEGPWVEISVPRVGPYLLGMMYWFTKRVISKMIENVKLPALNNDIFRYLNFKYRLEELLSSNSTQLINKPTRTNWRRLLFFTTVHTGRCNTNYFWLSLFCYHSAGCIELHCSKGGQNHIKIRDCKRFDKYSILIMGNTANVLLVLW